MDRHHRSRARGYPAREVGRIEVEVVVADIGQYGSRPRVDDHVGSRRKSEDARYHLVTRSDAGGKERKVEAGRARVQSNGLLTSCEVAELALEALRLRAVSEPARAECIQDLGGFFLSEL